MPASLGSRAIGRVPVYLLAAAPRTLLVLETDGRLAIQTAREEGSTTVLADEGLQTSRHPSAWQYMLSFLPAPSWCVGQWDEKRRYRSTRFGVYDGLLEKNDVPEPSPTYLLTLSRHTGHKRMSRFTHTLHCAAQTAYKPRVLLCRDKQSAPNAS